MRVSGLFVTLRFLLCAGLFAFWGCGAPPPPPTPLATPLPELSDDELPVYTFAAVGSNVLKTNREVLPILRYLGRRVGARFRLVYCESYKKIMQVVREDAADFAWLAARTYLTLETDTGCVPLAQYLRRGQPSYRGILVVPRDSKAQSVNDLKGTRLALVNRNSTSGYVYPMYYFHRHGIVPDRFFRRITYEGKHENALLAVVRGNADAACLEEPVLRFFEGKVDLASIRILGVTGLIPNGPIVARRALSDELRERVATALTGMERDAEGRKVIEALRANTEFTGFGPAKAGAFDEVRAAVKAAGLEAKR